MEGIVIGEQKQGIQKIFALLEMKELKLGSKIKLRKFSLKIEENQ